MTEQSAREKTVAWLEASGIASLVKVWVAATKQEDPVKNMLADKIATYLLQNFLKLPVTAAGSGEDGAEAFDPADKIVEWLRGNKKFADAVADLQRIFPELEADDLVYPPAKLVTLSGFEVPGLDPGAFDQQRTTFIEKKGVKDSQKEQADAAKKSATRTRWILIGVGFFLAFVLAFVVTFYGDTIKGLLPDSGAASEAVNNGTDPALRNAPIDMEGTNFRVYILWPSGAVLPAYQDAAMAANPGGPVCGSLDPGKQYAVTVVPGKTTAIQNGAQEQVVLYDDLAAGTKCFTARSAFNWNDGNGAPIAYQLVALNDPNYVGFVDTLKSLGYSTGLLGLFSKDELFGTIARFIFLMAGIAIVGQFLSKGQWVDVLFALGLGLMAYLYNQVSLSPWQYILSLIGWTWLALGLGSRTSRQSLHARQLATIPTMPDGERAEAESATKHWVINSVEWNWGALFWGIQIWFILFSPTSRTLVSYLGPVGASLVALSCNFIFDVLEAVRRHTLLFIAKGVTGLDEWRQKYADAMSVAVNIIATIVACTLIVSVGDVKMLSAYMAALFAVVFGLGFVFQGSGERSTERPFDMLASVAFYTVAALPMLAVFLGG